MTEDETIISSNSLSPTSDYARAVGAFLGLGELPQSEGMLGHYQPIADSIAMPMTPMIQKAMKMARSVRMSRFMEPSFLNREGAW